MGLAFWTGAFAPLHRMARTDPLKAGRRRSGIRRGKRSGSSPPLVVAGGALWVVLTGDPIGAIGTPFGRLLLVKLCLFAPLLGLAAYNKLRLTPALGAGDARATTKLRRSIRLELLVVLAILLTTATLTTVASPGALA